MSFNPDEYLKAKRTARESTQETPAVTSTAFDPDAFLKARRAAAEVGSGAVSKTESALRGAAQGATLGFSDEIVGAAEGFINTLKGNGGSLSENYTKSRDESRAANKAAEEANSLAYLGGNLAGGVATSFIPGAGAVGIGKAAASVIKGGGVLAKIARGVVGAGSTGAVLGVVQGAGSSEGKTVGENVGDALKGGATGAALGGAFGGAGKLLPGVRDSVSNDLYRKVLGATVGDDAAELATKYLKSPEARNAIVAATKKETVDKVKETVASHITEDVAVMRKEAAALGAGLLARVDDQMASKVNDLQGRMKKVFEPAAANMNGDPGKNLRSLVTEVNQILTGENVAVVGMVGEEVGERLVTAPNAQVMRDVRDAIKMRLYKQGDPGQGLQNVSSSEAKIMKSMLSEVQRSFKSIPEAAKADAMYHAASDYAQAVESKLFRNGSPSSAAIESWILGKGTAGAVEDKDNLFALRDVAVKALERSNDRFGKGAIEKTREVMDFNRLGAGEMTGRSTAGLTAANVVASLAGGPTGAVMAGALTTAAYNPRLYLRALAMADNLTSEDRKIMAALVKSLKLESVKQTDKRRKED